MLRYKTETRPGLVALYDIRPGNGAGQFLQPRSLQGAVEHTVLHAIYAFKLYSLFNSSDLRIGFQATINPGFRVLGNPGWKPYYQHIHAPFITVKNNTSSAFAANRCVLTYQCDNGRLRWSRHLRGV